MEKALKKLCDDYTSSPESGKRLYNELLVLFSKNDSSEFEMQRLLDWLQEFKREPAQTKFTAGITRNVAREFESLLKRSR